MHRHWQTGIVVVGLIVCVAISAAGQDESVKKSTGTEKRREREKLFREMLEETVLQGSWQMTGEEGLTGRAPLAPAKEDRYTIGKVSKASDDYWIINARVEYADKDVTIPVTVRVVWAGDTPIITLDKVALPGLGTYSARVMIHRGFYAGTWFGTNYGGVMSGQVLKTAPQKEAASRPVKD